MTEQADQGGKTFWSAAVKEVDQMSPLLVKRMPQRYTMLLVGILAVTYLTAITFQVGTLFGSCTEANNCIICSVALSNSAGSCTSLAATSLNFAAGCTSYGMVNDVTRIKAVIGGINSTVESLKKASRINDDLYNSLKYHHEITDAITSNKQGQMTDLDADKVLAFTRVNYYGISDVMGSVAETAADFKFTANQRAVARSVGLKLLYSYIATGCTIYESSKGDTNAFVTKAETIHSETLQTTEFPTCGCDLYCPFLLPNGTVTVDDVVGAFDVSIDGSMGPRNGLGEVNLVLPDKYMIRNKDFANVNNADITDAQASVEMVYVKDGELQHCPTSVFTNTPTTLNGAFFECCVEKTTLEKLSQVSAFSSFVMTCAILLTTLVFWPCAGGSRGEVKGTALDTFSGFATA